MTHPWLWVVQHLPDIHFTTLGFGSVPSIGNHSSQQRRGVGPPHRLTPLLLKYAAGSMSHARTQPSSPRQHSPTTHFPNHANNHSLLTVTERSGCRRSLKKVTQPLAEINMLFQYLPVVRHNNHISLRHMLSKFNHQRN